MCVKCVIHAVGQIGNQGIATKIRTLSFSFVNEIFDLLEQILTIEANVKELQVIILNRAVGQFGNQGISTKN